MSPFQAQVFRQFSADRKQSYVYRQSFFSKRIHLICLENYRSDGSVSSSYDAGMWFNGDSSPANRMFRNAAGAMNGRLSHLASRARRLLEALRPASHSHWNALNR